MLGRLRYYDEQGRWKIFFFFYSTKFDKIWQRKVVKYNHPKGELEMRLTDKQLKRFTEVFEIKAKSIIMIAKGRKATIIINSVRIFDVKRELVHKFL